MMTEQELERLYTESYKQVYWTAMSILKNNEEAEDVVQDTFITAYNSYDSLNDKTKAVAWIKKIAANKCLNIVTRRRTVNVEDEILENTESVPEDFLPDSIVESSEKRKIIMDIIDRTLSEDTRMTIILFYFNEMSIREIADRLNIPQGTVLSRLNYAKKKIRTEVEKYEKKSNDKLFGAVPFLTLLFEEEAKKIPFSPIPAAIKAATSSFGKGAGEAGAKAAAKASGQAAKSAGESTKAAVQASGQAAKSAASASAKSAALASAKSAASASAKSAALSAAATGAKAAATGIIIRNVAIGLAAALLVGGGGLFAYKQLAEGKNPPKETSLEETEETSSDIAPDETSATEETSATGETSGTSETSETFRTPADNRGMTPEDLDLHEGYVRHGTVQNTAEGSETLGNDTYYDAKGQLILDIGYDENGNVNFSDYCEYDAQGRVVYEILWDTSLSPYGTVTSYTYGDNGIDYSETGTLGQDPDHYYTYDYDEHGRLIRETRHNFNSDSIFWYQDYRYEDDGTYRTVITSFDTLHQRMEEQDCYSIYSADGILLETYDARLYWTIHDVYTYAPDGTLTLWEHSQGSDLINSTAYEYDQNGRLISERTETRDGGLIETTYVYEELR